MKGTKNEQAPDNVRPPPRPVRSLGHALPGGVVTTIDFRLEIKRARELGLELPCIQLVVPRRGGNSPPNWSRCLVAKGRPQLWGRCIGAGRILGYWRMEVTADDLERWLDGEPVR